MRRIALASEKGGTSKTTTTLALAACLSRAGRRVLVIDCDPQGNASLILLRGESPRRPTLHEVLLGEAAGADAIVKTATPGVDLLPSDASLAEANVGLVNEVGRECRLRAGLAELRQPYDFALVDCPPTRSLLVVNALTFAEEVIIPVVPGVFSIAGLGQIRGVVEEVRQYLGHPVRVAGLLLAMVGRDNVSRDTEVQLRDAFGSQVYRTTVPRSVAVEAAHSRFATIVEYSPRSVVARAYQTLAEEITDDGQRETDGTGDGISGTPETDGRAA